MLKRGLQAMRYCATRCISLARLLAKQTLDASDMDDLFALLKAASLQARPMHAAVINSPRVRAWLRRRFSAAFAGLGVNQVRQFSRWRRQLPGIPAPQRPVVTHPQLSSPSQERP